MMREEWRARLVIQEEKLTRYLLVPNHPIGGPKARFFLGVGFSSGNLPRMRSALLDHGETAPLERQAVCGYGLRYTLIGAVSAPNGRIYTVKSVWMEGRPGSPVRMVTAYPYKRGSRDGA